MNNVVRNYTQVWDPASTRTLPALELDDGAMKERLDRAGRACGLEPERTTGPRVAR